MKNNLFKLINLIITVLVSALITSAVIKAGTLTPAAVPAATSYTLTDIYTRLTTNAAATLGNHVFAPAAVPAGTLYTLTQVYNAIPTIDPTKVLAGTTYLGIAGTITDIGQQTITPTITNTTITAGYHDGTGYCEGDADLVAGNIKNAVNIFGVAGTYSGGQIDWSLQKNVRYDDWKDSGGVTGEYTGEETTWIQTDAGGDAAKSVTDNFVTISLNSNEVWQDTETDLYWSDRTADLIDNEFDVSACNFTAAGDANDDPACDNYDPGAGYSEDNDVSANEFCLNLGLDADNDAVLETDWRLPSQKELQQAYINGSANNLPSVVGGFYFWSATENSGNAGEAWYVSLAYGYAYTNGKDNIYHVCCVRP